MLCVVLTVLLIISVAIVIIGGALFAPQTTTNEHITIPDVTSSQPIVQAQSNPLVVLLDELTSEKYSSFIVSLNVAKTGDVSSKIWISQTLNIVSNTYSSKDIILPDTSYSTRFYALAGSTFNVNFPSLTGSDGTSAVVELRQIDGTVLKSQSVNPSTDSKSVTFSLEIPGLVELHVVNEGVSGTLNYNIMIKEISLGGAEYVCTVNSVNTCKGTSVYENNYILAQTTPESDSTIYITLVGKEILGPAETIRPYETIAIVLVVVGVVGLLLVISLFVLLLVCYCKYGDYTSF